MKTARLPRRVFLQTCAATALACWRGARLFGAPAAGAPRAEITWHDVRDLGIEGRGWPAEAMERYYDRLPARAKGRVRGAVWNLSRHSAGMLTRFRSDATAVHVRYALLSPTLALPHMPATGVSGADLYARDRDGRWRWVAVARPEKQKVEQVLNRQPLDAGEKEFQLYLPLYNGVESLEIGVPAGATFAPISPRSAPPVLFYGTSITHGACASRPGMTHVAILGRKLDLPIINLGFSGNGMMELEVGEFLIEVPAAAFVIDCLPNMNGEQVATRTEPLVRQLRAAQPETPIVLVEDRTSTNAWLTPELRERHSASRSALRAAHDRLRGDGVKRLFYLAGERLLGDDDEATTDGSHPSDLGFARQADAFLPVLREALSRG